MQKANETKEEKGTSVEKLRGYDDVACEFALYILTYLNESLTSPSCLYEFNAALVQWEK